MKLFGWISAIWALLSQNVIKTFTHCSECDMMFNEQRKTIFVAAFDLDQSQSLKCHICILLLFIIIDISLYLISMFNSNEITLFSHPRKLSS